MNKRKIINDPVYGFIAIPTELIYDLIAHPYLQRLNRIKQLGLTYLVYPGAQHTRFQHALGAMHLMTQALDVLKGKGVEITAEEAEAATVAILLHDLGHGPFSHTLEHLIIPAMSHEQLTLCLMDQLNLEFGGKLDPAIRIFRGEYPKPFLHQLVSSQLDMDRLDYLNRDSFYTGVAEGVIGWDRIIKMLAVHENQLVVEEKGIYSIEKFLISRRLMYWQVYLHKTVLAAEEMLKQIMRRARSLIAGNPRLAAPPLSEFLNPEVNEFRTTADAALLNRFTELDDNDIMQAIKTWQHAEDKVLSFLCRHLLRRQLFRLELHNQPLSTNYCNALHERLQRLAPVSEEEASHLIISGSTSNHAYNPTMEVIQILFKNGSIRDVSEASDLLNISALREPRIKYFVCYPKEIKLPAS